MQTLLYRDILCIGVGHNSTHPPTFHSIPVLSFFPLLSPLLFSQEHHLQIVVEPAVLEEKDVYADEEYRDVRATLVTWDDSDPSRLLRQRSSGVV